MLGVRAEAHRAPVYNLTVEGEPEYFANGVLVHNCDSSGYIVSAIDMKLVGAELA